MKALSEATKIRVLGLGRKEEMFQIPTADFPTMVARKNIEVGGKPEGGKGGKMEECGVRRTSLMLHCSRMVLHNLSAVRCGKQLEVVY